MSNETFCVRAFYQPVSFDNLPKPGSTSGTVNMYDPCALREASILQRRRRRQVNQFQVLMCFLTNKQMNTRSPNSTENPRIVLFLITDGGKTGIFSYCTRIYFVASGDRIV